MITITSLGKGSLSNHLDKLQANGLITIKTVLKVGGPRVIVEITEKGMEAYRNYSALLNKIMSLK